MRLGKEGNTLIHSAQSWSLKEKQLKRAETWAFPTLSTAKFCVFTENLNLNLF
jgi:hypothetical protein